MKSTLSTRQQGEESRDRAREIGNALLWVERLGFLVWWRSGCPVGEGKLGSAWAVLQFQAATTAGRSQARERQKQRCVSTPRPEGGAETLPRHGHPWEQIPVIALTC